MSSLLALVKQSAIKELSFVGNILFNELKLSEQTKPVIEASASLK